MTIQVADRLYLTEVDVDIHGDAFFPEIDYSLWREEIVEYPKVTAKYSYKFVTLDRK
jgi:dihydrofolate reductase